MMNCEKERIFYTVDLLDDTKHHQTVQGFLYAADFKEAGADLDCYYGDRIITPMKL